MNIIGEYLKLIPLAFKNRGDIVESIITKVEAALGTLPQDEKEEVVRRALICEDCPFNSKNISKEDYQTVRVDDHCIHCQCNIEYKVSCISCNCGLEVWNINNPNDKIPLKWEAYKKPKNERNR